MIVMNGYGNWLTDGLKALDPTVSGSVGSRLVGQVSTTAQQALTTVGQANAAAAAQARAAQAQAAAGATAYPVGYVPPSFFARNKIPLIVGGVSVLLLGAAMMMRHRKAA